MVNIKRDTLCSILVVVDEADFGNYMISINLEYSVAGMAMHQS